MHGRAATQQREGLIASVRDALCKLREDPAIADVKDKGLAALAHHTPITQTLYTALEKDGSAFLPLYEQTLQYAHGKAGVDPFSVLARQFWAALATHMKVATPDAFVTCREVRISWLKFACHGDTSPL